MSRQKKPEDEWTEIRDKIKATAKEMILQTSVRKIGIRDLCGAAGVSASSFYKLFETKEILFLEIIEDFHSEIVRMARDVLREKVDLPPVERMTEAFWVALNYYDTNHLMRFFQEDMQYVLDKVPGSHLNNHYHGHVQHFQEILEGSGLEIKVSLEMIHSFVHILMLSMIFKDLSGEMYTPALRVLVRSACEFALNGPE